MTMTMTREDLLSLADRIEKATGANFELERDIALAMGFGKTAIPKAYTASLDAAMTLVPEGWGDWSLYSYGEATVSRRLFEAGASRRIFCDGKAATPALALCAAALRAQASSLKENDSGR